MTGNVTMGGVALAASCGGGGSGGGAPPVGCVLSYSQTEVTFRTLEDPGTGAKVAIDLMVGGQGTGQAGKFLAFGYDAPTIASVTPRLGPTNGLMPSGLLGGRRNSGRDAPFAVTGVSVWGKEPPPS